MNRYGISQKGRYNRRSKEKSTDSNPLRPTCLKTVAGLFIFEGACTAVAALLHLMYVPFDVVLPAEFGVLGLFIGPGLLRFSRGWRTCALVLLWITLVGTPILTLVSLSSHWPINFLVFGYNTGLASQGIVLAIGALGFVLALWEYWVLNRSDIRALFDVDKT